MLKYGGDGSDMRPLSSLLRYLVQPSFVVGSVVIGVLFSFAMIGYRRFVVEGLRAEAHLMTSYIVTLERAFQLEHGSFATFSPYGAANLGIGQCDIPDGAEQLGFQIGWCQGILGRAPARYFYQAYVEEGSTDQLMIKATSGSDALGRSFVCFGDFEMDEWNVDLKLSRLHLSDCQKNSL